MAERKPAKKGTKGTAKRTTAPRNSSTRFTAEERAAVKEHARELKASSNKEEAAKEVLAKIAAMKEPDRGMARRLHEVILNAAPDLEPRTWYGMPAYAKDGKVLCFFQGAQKFKTRYATLGFSDKANLDAGSMWPTTFALMALTATEEAKISELVKKAVS
jgi:uncharacterized protein YdhG (YjbR/CyaY superfamily)